MKINDISQDQRPRERLINHGVSVLSDIELLSIILNTGTKGKSVIDISTSILKNYNIHELLNLSYEQLIKIDGIKQRKACLILASLELAKRSIYNSNYKDLDLSKPKNIYNYIISEYKFIRIEKFYCLYLDNNLKLIKKVLINTGSVNKITFDIKDIINNFVILNATCCILIHNHPSLIAKPSNEDILITKKLVDILKSIGYCLLDHIIITNEDYFSFLENNYI